MRQLVACTTLGEALREGLAHYHLLVDNFVPRLAVQGDIARLQFRLRRATELHDPRLDYGVKAFMLITFNAASWLVARRIPLLGVEYTPGLGSADTSRVYRVPVRSGALHVGLSFEARWLDLPAVQSAQSLRRRLHDGGRGFPQIKDETRRDAAIELLLHTPLPLPEIAARLGFSEASTFHRAHKQWTGVAPGAYRHAHGPS